MANEPEKPTIQSLYAKQFADDLAANREEQARLRERLEQLKADEAWLVKALETMPVPAGSGSGAEPPRDESVQPQDSASEPAEPAETAEPALEAATAVPKQRQDKPAKRTAAAKKTTAKKTAAKRSTAKNTTAKQAPAAKETAKQAPVAKKSASKAGDPSLGELLLNILGQHAGQPRTASEVAGDLEREYPERARDINTVRNTLERLVAKSRIERMKQKNTVLYTSPAAESAPAAEDAGAKASPAAETADTEEAEKAPAQA